MILDSDISFRLHIDMGIKPSVKPTVTEVQQFKNQTDTQKLINAFISGRHDNSAVN